jgi:hypothetical protein
MAITLDSISYDLHSIEIKSAAGNGLAIDASGYITANVNGDVNVTASDLDIRDLTHVSDSVKVGDGSVFLDLDASGYITANINGDVNVTQGTSPWVVSATDLDIRDLTQTDEITAYQGGSWSIATFEDGYDTWKSTAHAANATVSEIASTPLASRIRMNVQNLGANDVFIGESNAVTVSTGTKVPKGGSADFKWGASADVWVICDTGQSADLRIMEFAA